MMAVGYIFPDGHVHLELARYVSFELFIQRVFSLPEQTEGTVTEREIPWESF